jgi:putative FmdB family regulatory protein
MPIFDYQCGSCGNTFELLLLKNSPTPACPSCASEDLTKLLSAPIVSSHDSRRRSYYDYERRKASQRQAQNLEKDHSHDHDHHSI